LTHGIIAQGKEEEELRIEEKDEQEVERVDGSRGVYSRRISERGLGFPEIGEERQME